MYQIFADGVRIYDDTVPGPWALAPKLTQTAGAAGSLSFTIPKGAAGYDSVQRLTSTISVLRDGETIWMGRPLSEERDLWDGRVIFCEGALAWLNDTVPMVTDPTMSLILQAHNLKELPDRQIQFGGAWTPEYLTAEADGSTSLGLATRMTQELGGLLEMKYPGGIPTLYWLQNYPAAAGNEQELVFGENLLDFTRRWDMTDFATVCYVRGAEIQDADGHGTGTYYNSGWVASPAAAIYGRIEKFLNYSDLDSNALCINEADAYLRNQQFAEMQISVSALDLHILNPAVKAFDLLERVHVVSPPHGLDGAFAVTNLEIPLDAPEKTTYTLGFVNVDYVRRVRTLTKQQLRQEEETQGAIKETHDYAKEQAATAYNMASQELAAARVEIDEEMNERTQGYILIDSGQGGTQAIYITDSPITDPNQITAGMHVWRWNMDGLGYSEDGGTTWLTALTKYGKIKSDFLIASELWADVIRLYGDMNVYNGSQEYIGGSIGYGNGRNQYGDPTPGIHMFVDNGGVEMIVTSAGARMSFGQYHLYVAGNGVHIVNGADPLLGCPMRIDGDLTVAGNINYTGSLNPI